MRWALLACTACFDPHPHLGQTCTSWCPPPEQCISGQCVTSPGGGDGAIPTANLMFVTSTKKTPTEMGGIANADAWCNDLAGAAGLQGHYIAWLSDQSAASARQRLTAKNARGWYRMDGLPFADTIDDIVNGHIYYPPRFDEKGTDLFGDADRIVGTGTYWYGDDLGLGGDCIGFTSATATMIAGYLDGGAHAWTDGTDMLDCATAVRIYCFGYDLNVAIPAPAAPAGSRLAFLAPATSGGGLAKLDTACANAAIADNLTGTFLAWASSTTAPASTRFTGPRPWRRVDNVLVMSSTFEQFAPIDQILSGDHSNGHTWTGSLLPSEQPAPTENCSDWTSTVSTSHAITGVVARGTLAESFGGGIGNCNETSQTYAYCLEQ